MFMCLLLLLFFISFISNGFLCSYFSYSHITFDAVIFWEKKSIMLFFIFMMREKKERERLCMNGREKHMWMLYNGFEGRKLNYDNRFFFMTQTTFWSIWNVDALSRKKKIWTTWNRIVNVSKNEIETVITWRYRIQLMMQIQWSEAVIWSTTSTKKKVSQSTRVWICLWLSSHFSLSISWSALQLNFIHDCNFDSDVRWMR